MKRPITLMGMSNCGKSYWSNKLEKIKKFKRYCCDDIIEFKLGFELLSKGYRGVQDVAKWMGQPFDLQYPKTSKKYLRFEREAIKEILESIESTSTAKSIVIDTTGSIIYLSKNILKVLRQKTLIVYLDASPDVKEELYQKYLKNPKPVIWGNSFAQKEWEAEMDALRKCYPYLLDFRTEKYKKLAHINLDYYKLRKPNFTVEDFLESTNI